MCTADGQGLGSVAEALRMTRAGLDYLNGPGAGELDAAACGAVLRSLGEIEAKFTAAHASVLARFDAADAHDCDGYGTSAAWLMAMADMTRPDAKTKVWRMRLLRDHPEMAGALADADISKSQALAIAKWTKKLPAELRAETIRILVQAATAGASLDDLRIIAAVAEQRWRASRPDGDEDGFDDRYVQAGTTFGGAGVIRGNLTPECAAAVQAVLEALGKKAGPEDPRTEGQRFHDALQQGCELLIRAKMVPDRAGADTHVAVHIPFPELRQRPGAPEAEEVWLRGTAGEPGYLTGKDAEAAACDALATRWSPGTRTCGWSTRSSPSHWPRPASPWAAQTPVRQMAVRPVTVTAAARITAAPTAVARATPAVTAAGWPRQTTQTATVATATAPGAPRAAEPHAGRVPRPQPGPGAVHPRRDAGAAVRHRPARHRLRLRPGRHRRLAAHHPPRTPVHHAVAAAGHRLLRLDPGQHPPRRPAPRPRLRLAALRTARRLVRRAPPAAQERRRQDLRQQLRAAVPVPP